MEIDRRTLHIFMYISAQTTTHTGIRSNLLFHDAQVRPELDPDLNSSVTHYASSSSSPASSASPLRSGKQRKMLQQQQQQQYSYHRITLMMIVSPGEQEEKNHRGLATRKLKASGVLHGDADNDAGGDDDDDGTKWAERFYNAVFMPCQIKHCQLLRKHCRPCRQRRARLKRERSATHNDSNSTSHKASLHSTPTAAAGAPAGRGSVDTETRGPSNVFQAGEKEKEKASTLSSTCGTCDTQCQNVRSSMPAFREVSRKPGMPSSPLASLPPLCSE